MTTKQNLPTPHLIQIAIIEMSEEFHRHFQSAVAEMGITPVQAAVLRFSDQPTRMGALADRIRCQPSHITSVVDTLEERGWVTRGIDPTDRRVQNVVRTQEGERAGERIMDHLSVTASPMLANLTDGEQRSLLELLYKAIGHEIAP